MRPLDVAVVANNIRRRDGEGHVMLEISRGLLDNGHRVTAFSSTCSDELIVRERFEWHKVEGIPGPDMIAHFTFALASTRALSKHRFDAVCTMGPCGFTRDPVVVYSAFTQRGWQASWALNRPDAYRRAHSASARFLENRAFRRAAGVLPISASVAKELEPIIPKNALVEMVPGGVDLEDFGSERGADREVTRRSLGIHTDAFVVVLIGEFATGRKGLPKLIQAAALANDPKEVVVVHGGGSQASARKSARLMGLADPRLVFAPPKLPVVDVLKAADIVAIPSTYEPFSLVALEAGACRKPIIISDRAGVAPFFVAANAALAVDPVDAGALRAAIDKLKHDTALRAELGEKARVVASEFEWSNVGRKASTAIERVALG